MDGKLWHYNVFPYHVQSIVSKRFRILKHYGTKLFSLKYRPLGDHLSDTYISQYHITNASHGLGAETKLKMKNKTTNEGDKYICNGYLILLIEINVITVM